MNAYPKAGPSRQHKLIMPSLDVTVTSPIAIKLLTGVFNGLISNSCRLELAFESIDAMNVWFSQKIAAAFLLRFLSLRNPAFNDFWRRTGA